MDDSHHVKPALYREPTSGVEARVRYALHKAGFDGVMTTAKPASKGDMTWTEIS